jgi:hypothetical protein
MRQTIVLMGVYCTVGGARLNLNPGVKNSTHIFYHTIKPILLYGCEIWGAFNTQTACFRNNLINLDEIFSKALFEILHVKFCRYILGVHKKSAKFAVLAELGRFPLCFNVVSQLLSYSHSKTRKFPLLQAAYNADKYYNFQNKTYHLGKYKHAIKVFSKVIYGISAFYLIVS